jgi:hypothetical protein
MRHRLGSVTSIASSETDEDIQHRALETEWTESDDEFLLNVYQEQVDNPMNAPFAGRVPPSGIIQLTVRDTIKRAKLNDRQFIHSPQSIRRRLIYLCSKQVRTYNRNNSIISSFDGSMPSTPIDRGVFNFVELGALTNRIDSPLEKLAASHNDDHLRNWVLTTPTNNSNNNNNNSNNNSSINDFFHGDIGKFPPKRPLASPFEGHNSRPLASPFEGQFKASSSTNSTSTPFNPSFSIQQPTPISLVKNKITNNANIEPFEEGDQSPTRPLQTETTVNVTSKRKRDSLKLKRQGKK